MHRDRSNGQIPRADLFSDTKKELVHAKSIPRNIDKKNFEAPSYNMSKVLSLKALTSQVSETLLQPAILDAS